MWLFLFRNITSCVHITTETVLKGDKENLTFSIIGAINAIIGSPVHLPTQKMWKQQPSKFFLVNLSLQACEKKWAAQISFPRNVEKGSYYNITAP